MRGSALDKVFAFTEDKALFSAPCRILIGVSGGADSMALLHMLSHWPLPGIQVSAIHIHHGLRGAEADADASFVSSYCAQHDIPLTTIELDVGALAAQEHLTLEEAGRKARYTHFEIERQRIGADYIVTAHSASDLAETVLMRILRGCSIEGLVGIPHYRGYIRRPLLCCSRQEIEDYCTQEGIRYVNDVTNNDLQFHRNAIRHELLPILRQYNPSVDNALIRLSNHASADSEFLSHIANDALTDAQCERGYRLSAFIAQPSVILRRMIRRLMMDAGVSSFEEAHIVAAEQAILHGSGAVSLSNGYRFAVQQGIVSVYAENTALPSEPVMVAELPFAVFFNSATFKLFLQENVKINKLLLNSAIDYDKIVGKLYWRCRQSGDYMHPHGRGIGKSLKKLMNERRIPAHLRDAYPVLCDENGVILVPGIACDNRVCITEDTSRYLICEMDAAQQ